MTDYARRAAKRWYVIVFAVVAAVLLVFLHGVSAATKQSSASASVYLGQPFGPGGSSVLAGTPLSNPTISITYVTAPKQINTAAQAAGINPRLLRSHVSVIASGGAVTGAKAATGGGPPTITITVEGPWSKHKVQTATNSLANSLIGVVYQVLLPRAAYDGFVLAAEILANSPPVTPATTRRAVRRITSLGRLIGALPTRHIVRKRTNVQ